MWNSCTSVVPNTCAFEQQRRVSLEKDRFTSASVFLHFRTEFQKMCTFSCTGGKEQVPFSMAMGNGELMQECFPKHSRMGTARTK